MRPSKIRVEKNCHCEEPRNEAIWVWVQKSPPAHPLVIPAKAGIHLAFHRTMDSRFRGNDNWLSGFVVLDLRDMPCRGPLGARSWLS